MERITGKITKEFTIDEVTYINALIERDKPKMARKRDGYTCTECPVCGSMVGHNDRFCDKCGQRIDQENIEI